MSEFTPNEAQLVAGYAESGYLKSQGMQSRDEAEREARRAVAKIKTEAQIGILREFARECDEEYEQRTAKSGAYGQKKIRAALVMAGRLADTRADQIEKETGREH